MKRDLVPQKCNSIRYCNSIDNATAERAAAEFDRFEIQIAASALNACITRQQPHFPRLRMYVFR